MTMCVCVCAFAIERERDREIVFERESTRISTNIFCTLYENNRYNLVYISKAIDGSFQNKNRSSENKVSVQVDKKYCS